MGILRRAAAAALFASAVCGIAVTTPWAGAQALPVGQVVVLINRNSGQCVTNTGSTQIGLQLGQRTCQGLNSEQWTLRAVTGGYRIVSRFDNMCMAVAGASTADGAAIQQWTCNLGDMQKWKAAERQLAPARIGGQRQVLGGQRRLTGRWGRVDPELMPRRRQREVDDLGISLAVGLGSGGHVSDRAGSGRQHGGWPAGPLVGL
jgi:hypothetical protein